MIDGIDLAFRGYRSLYMAGAQRLMDLTEVSKADQNRIWNEMSGLPLVGDMVRERDRQKYISDYMRNRGITWDDVKYPSMVDTGQGTSSRLYGFVSSNISRLYR